MIGLLDRGVVATMKPYYQDKWVTIYHGDCRELLQQLDVKVDLVLTDPPYGIKRDKGFEGFGGFGEPIARRRYEDDEWDRHRVPAELLRAVVGIAPKAIVFGGNFYADILPQSNHWLVWDKLQTMPTFGDCELIWTNIQRDSVRKYTVEYNGLLGKENHRWHPTQKPIELVARIVADYTEGGQVVCDPFLGSGTTCYCAKKLLRYSIGCEVEERYCEVAARRCRQEVMELV